MSEVTFNNYNPNVVTQNEYNIILFSLKKFGQVVPLLVRAEKEKFIIIDGEHRFRAMKELQFTECYCIIYEKESDMDAYKMLTVAMNHPYGNMPNENLRKVFADSKQELVSEFLTKFGISLEKKMELKSKEQADLFQKFDLNWDSDDAWEVTEPDYETLTVLGSHEEIEQIKQLQKIFESWEMTALKGFVDYVSQADIKPDEKFYLLYQLAQKRAFEARKMVFRNQPDKPITIVVRGKPAVIEEVLKKYMELMK